MPKKKLEVRASVNVIGLSLRNLDKVLSDVKFISEMEIKHKGIIEEPEFRNINVSGGPELYNIRYEISDFGVSGTELGEGKEYTCGQLREMRYRKRE